MIMFAPVSKCNVFCSKSTMYNLVICQMCLVRLLMTLEAHQSHYKTVFVCAFIFKSASQLGITIHLCKILTKHSKHA